MFDFVEKQLLKDKSSKRFPAFNKVKSVKAVRAFAYWVLAITLLLLIGLFLPWTQNINANGQVTMLQPEQRPQTIHTIIAGSINKWFVKDGDYVEEGDTLLFIREVKDAYFDPGLIERTQGQIEAKKLSIKGYESKIESQSKQLKALQESMELKLEQTQNKIDQAKLKVISDSVDIEAAKTDYEVAMKQYERAEELYKQGLKSLTEVENKKAKLQETTAKYISQQNKLLASKNELLNAQIEMSAVEADYIDKLSKTDAERFSAMSGLAEAEAQLIKLQNQFMNYNIRSGFYYITAPRNGYITEMLRTGVGEVIKEGEAVATIVPTQVDMAVELYVRPMDRPLVSKGQTFRLQFDGWPAIVFSGWPGVSFGTFGAEVLAVDNVTSPNGMFRVLVVPDPNDAEWPELIRAGGGVRGWALLNDVPVWYELWRQFNGFPPEFYRPKGASINDQGTKANDKPKKK